jgi:hypothetical protein
MNHYLLGDEYSYDTAASLLVLKIASGPPSECLIAVRLAASMINTEK